MAQLMISLSSGVDKFKWFKFDKDAVELSFDKLRHNKEYALDIHPGNVFGVMPSGKNFIVVHKESPEVQFTLTAAEVKKLEANSAGWKGKVKSVSVQAGVGGKDAAPALPVIAPTNLPDSKPTKPARKSDTELTHNARGEEFDKKTVNIRIAKQLAEDWMDLEQNDFKASKEDKNHVYAIIRRQRIDTAQDLIALMASMAETNLIEKDREAFRIMAEALIRIGEEYPLRKTGQVIFNHYSDALKALLKAPRRAIKPPPKVEPQIDTSANKHAVTVTDSKGQSFTLPNRSGRKLNYVVVATFPAHAPTSLSAGNPESRSAPGGHETQAQAIKQAKHLQKHFRAFNIEVIKVV